MPADDRREQPPLSDAERIALAARVRALRDDPRVRAELEQLVADERETLDGLGDDDGPAAR